MSRWSRFASRSVGALLAAALPCSLALTLPRLALADPPTARCNAQGEPRIAPGPVPDWRAALPQGAHPEVLTAEDVDGDGVADAVLAVRADCRPQGSEEAWSLVVALHRPEGWTLQVLTPVSDPAEQYARVLVLGGERFVYHCVVRLADENMGNVSFYRVRSGAPLEPVAADEQDGTRGLRRVTAGRDGRVTIPCPGGRCEPTWNASATRVDLVPVRRSGRRPPSR